MQRHNTNKKTYSRAIIIDARQSSRQEIISLPINGPGKILHVWHGLELGRDMKMKLHLDDNIIDMCDSGHHRLNLNYRDRVAFEYNAPKNDSRIVMWIAIEYV
jgi:hypothetical protein